jgi:hypothetical protein
MVMVGHSMGGLVSRLLATDSGDDFWGLVSDRPLDELKVSPGTRAELQRVFFFRRQGCVEREIFLATPHHGSKLSPSLIGRLAARFVRMPNELMAVAGELAHADPGVVARMREAQFANSVDLLAPDAPALQLLAARPRPPRVHFHSIIGQVFGKGEKGSDGVVPYRSAHLEGVDSEILVSASHLAVHNHPRSVMEVRRILQEHLREVQREDGAIPIPVFEPPPIPKPADGAPTRFGSAR